MNERGISSLTKRLRLCRRRPKEWRQNTEMEIECCFVFYPQQGPTAIHPPTSYIANQEGTFLTLFPCSLDKMEQQQKKK